MSNWKESISQNVGSERISDLNNYVSVDSRKSMSAIDQFYDEMHKIINLFPLDMWGKNSWIGSLASIAIVSSVENYFRCILSEIIKICTDSQKKAAECNINFGSVIWHPSNDVGRGAFEHTSLASSEAICNVAKKFTGIELKGSELKTILEEFDKICELRHGIVHSANIIAGKNGIKLGVKPTSDVKKIDIGFEQFQEVMSICNALVVDANKLFFVELAKRWAISWRKSPSWDCTRSNIKFKEIWMIFFSMVDKNNGTIPANLSWIKCRNLVMQEYDVQ